MAAADGARRACRRQHHRRCRLATYRQFRCQARTVDDQRHWCVLSRQALPTSAHRVVPDVEVRPTIAGVRDGRDEVLKRASGRFSARPCR